MKTRARRDKMRDRRCTRARGCDSIMAGLLHLMIDEINVKQQMIAVK